jgi:Lon protease-like protein
MPVVPMFPLGSVLFPSMVLPLHVFEERYRALARDVLAGDRSFGVVLIERGSEVGGGDLRTDIGTLAEVAQAQEFDDGRFGLVAVGTRRFRVLRWLEDDPYPRAEIELLDDAAADAATADAGDADLEGYRQAVARLRSILATLAELGEPAAPATVELTDNPALGSFQLGAVSPFGPADRQRILAAPDTAGRLALVRDLLDDEHEFLAARMRLESSAGDGAADPGGE